MQATVITSVSAHGRVASLLALFCTQWTRLGYNVHVVIIDECVACEAILSSGSFPTVVTMEYMHSSDRSAPSLAGVSRYIAAARMQAAGLAVLSDVDLVPLSPMRTYMNRLTKEAARWPAKVTVDYAYPALRALHEKGRHQNVKLWLARKQFAFARTPRFRTCYLVGTAAAFASIVPTNLSDVYGWDTIQRAYSPLPTVWGLAAKGVRSHTPDASYDEILFGALAQPCLLNILAPRNHTRHPMVGEFHNTAWATPPSTAIDVHFSKRHKSLSPSMVALQNSLLGAGRSRSGGP